MNEDEITPQRAPWESDDGRRWSGAIMIALGVVLAVVAWVQWTNEQEHTESEERVGDLVDAMGGGPYTEEEVDPSGQIALGAVGAVLVLGGIVVYVSARDAQPPPS